MKSQPTKAALITILTIISTAVHAADFRSLNEFRENGAIEWTAGVVKAKGVGVSAANDDFNNSEVRRQETISEAVSKARQNLWQTIVDLRINSENRVRDIIKNQPSVVALLREMVFQAPEVEKLRRYLPNGAIEVWTQMQLSGGFSQLILPPEIRQIEPIKQVYTDKNSPNLRLPSLRSDLYTGLVVDARGIQAVPALAPRLLDENLEEVFGPSYVSREFAVQHGIARYIFDMREAEQHPLVAENPLIAKALKTLSPGRCDLIISNADAAKLQSASEHLVFLRQCRVMIVLNPMGVY